MEDINPNLVRNHEGIQNLKIRWLRWKIDVEQVRLDEIKKDLLS
jgi:hypothetical protein